MPNPSVDDRVRALERRLGADPDPERSLARTIEDRVAALEDNYIRLDARVAKLERHERERRS